MNEKTKKYGAIILCLVIGYLATVSTDLQSSAFGRVVMGGPMVALLVSMIACNIIPKLDKDFKAGTTFASKKFLNWGIILTGATLSSAYHLQHPPRVHGSAPGRKEDRSNKQHSDTGRRRYLYLRRYGDRYTVQNYQSAGRRDRVRDGSDLPV